PAPAEAVATVTDLPSWLAHATPAEAPAFRHISPSNAYDEAVAVRAALGAGRAEPEKARARGVLLHRLLDSLPGIAPPGAPAGAARRHLARAAREFTAEERESMIAELERVLDDARFGELFQPGSRAEVAIVGRLGTIAVAGAVDRLAVTGDSVLIGDYKTNRPAPCRLDDVPAPYIRQLALYRAVLRELYPGRAIRAALLWTDIPDLMEIPAAAMDRELAAVTCA